MMNKNVSVLSKDKLSIIDFSFAPLGSFFNFYTRIVNELHTTITK